jgi:hypothetical protein
VPSTPRCALSALLVYLLTTHGFAFLVRVSDDIRLQPTVRSRSSRLRQLVGQDGPADGRILRLRAKPQLPRFASQHCDVAAGLSLGPWRPGARTSREAHTQCRRSAFHPSSRHRGPSRQRGSDLPTAQTEPTITWRGGATVEASGGAPPRPARVLSRCHGPARARVPYPPVPSWPDPQGCLGLRHPSPPLTGGQMQQITDHLLATEKGNIQGGGPCPGGRPASLTKPMAQSWRYSSGLRPGTAGLAGARFAEPSRNRRRCQRG